MIIHTIWLGPQSTPADRSAMAIERSVKGHDFRYHRADDHLWESWQDKYQQVSHNRHMASDLLRHSVLRRWPGLYLDLDARLRVPADDLVEHWHTYTALALAPLPVIGTDVLYAPSSFGKWHRFDEYILQKHLGPKISYLAFAHDMLAAVYRADPTAIRVERDARQYPCHPRDVTVGSKVLRCDAKAPGLGDHVASALSAVGITKERVSKALGRPCGCKQRQQKMNDWGRKWLGIGGPG
jgi:hypothetical protein